ncbi:ARM repeat superfamily protein [Zea mays]|uniref:ARM repeat superfamily protein n=5 Tax=Zea mays TaxID=4577 RepID=A0A1D6NYI8_MAIZE|nr:ARM repeat superfamily protein [Zea mays]
MEAHGDQRWLVDCLTATLDTARDVRAFAEESLRQASLLPGYGAALTKVTINKEISFGLRQLAAVLLKQFIKQHWQEDEENFVPPVVSASEKVVIRQLLLTSLDDSNGKIRTAISMAVAAIGQQDWPEDWPELLPVLLKLIGDQSNGNEVRGALRCLALLSDDLDDMCVPKLVPELFPSLYRIISSPHLYENSLRAKAFAIVHSCISMLGSMSGVYKRDTASLMTSVLDPLIEQFSIVLNYPVQSQNPDDWSMQMEVLKCLLQLVQNFPRLPEAKISAILPALWQTFVSSFKTYHLSYIQGAETLDSISYDSDGSEKSLESFEIQLFELWTTIVGNSRLAKVIGGNIKELAYYTIALQQITEEQVQNWSRDANQYVADEDDLTYSCRVSGWFSGSLLLEELVTAYEDYGIDSIVEASQMRFHESRELKEAGSADWWRLHEASLFALGSLSEQLCEAQDSGLTKYNVRDLLEQMLIDIMGTGVHQYPFLHARAFSSVAKFSSLISKGVSEQYLCNAAHAIASDVPPPVKVGACRALAQLLPESNQNLIQPNIMGILSSLVDLLRQASDETLHLVLETLQSAIKSGGEQSTLIEPVISPIILDVWAQHIADPFISIDAVEVLEAIKNAPGCLQPLVSRILPTIGSILVKPKVQPDGLVAGSLDLLTMVLKNAPVAVVKAVFDTCFVSTVQIVLESDDHGEMQNATECLAAFISGGRQELLVWGGEQGQTLKMLLDAASRLLDPALESSVSLFVGSFVLQLILQIPLHLSPHIPDLIAAIMRRMQTSSIAGLKSSLIVIIARLVHMSAPNVDGFINLLLSIPAQGYDNSLVYIMSEWSQLQGEIQGAYQIKVTTTALALLISTRHPELSKVEVQGHLIKTSAGITTRSKARVTPDQWTKIPLPVKIFSLLADTLTEIQEQIGAGDDDDSEEDNDWEEVQNGDASISDDIIHSASVPSMTNPSVEHLNAMAKVFDEDDDDSYDDDLTKNDPLNEVKLADFLTNIFANLWENNRPIFEYLCQGLSDSQRSAVEKVLRR